MNKFQEKISSLSLASIFLISDTYKDTKTTFKKILCLI